MNLKNFDEFCSGVGHNISGPTTIAMAHADSTIGDFITALGKGSDYRPLGHPFQRNQAASALSAASLS